MTLKELSTRILYSFPIQLLLLHLRKNHVHLLYWVILWGFITEQFGDKFGVPYLFLDPEYMSSVGFWSFFMVGLALGAFIMTYNVSSYILHGREFPFLATLSRPFLKYTFNNCIIPLAFIATYIFKIVEFQRLNEYKSFLHLLLQIGGLVSGMEITVFMTITYFFSTNKDIFKVLGFNQIDLEPKPFQKKKINTKDNAIRVDSYVSSSFKLRLTRSAAHYDEVVLNNVFLQNHRNAALIEVTTFSIIIILGLFKDYSIFQIPAAASVLILFSMIMMLLGALRFWLKGWADMAFIVIFISLNYFSQFQWLSDANKGYGLNYNTIKAEYTPDVISKLHNASFVDQDSINTIRILEKWKHKAALAQGTDKPKLLIIGASGGGMRAAMWTVRCMQVTDSMLYGKLMDNTQMITGASGGIVGSSFYRELCLQNQIGDTLRRYGKQYFNTLGKDLLNPIAFSLCVSDIFVNLQFFKDGENRYMKDRAYAFEKQLNINTGFLLNKRLGDYTNSEQEAVIPMLIMAPSILNDGRRMIIASVPVSYLSSKSVTALRSFQPMDECVEFSKLFKNQDAARLYYTSALRMNSTFPYIMPNVSLPSSPTLELMDAGLRDNFGVRLSIKYLSVFKQWIDENTGGVIYLQIRDTPRRIAVKEMDKNTIMKTLSNPISSYYGNWEKVQDYTHDDMISLGSSWMGPNFHFLNLEMPVEKEKIALSWHLTTREKNYIYNAINHPLNQSTIKQLQILLNSPVTNP
jgi:hypothetical protein